MRTTLRRLSLLPACEMHRKQTPRRALVLCAVVALAALMPVAALAQPEAPPAATEQAHPPEEAHAADETHAAAEEHAGGLMDVVARLVNFSILVGALVYLLRSPFAGYLQE